MLDLFDPTQFIMALSSQLPTVEATDESPTTAMVRARADTTESPAARSVRITWWRPHGPTAIVPGLKRVTVKVRLPTANFVPSPTAMVSALDSSRPDDLFDELTNLPHPLLMTHLIDVFCRYFECQFPALSREVLLEAAQKRSGTGFLLNCVAAMAARFSKHQTIAKPDLKPHEYGQPYQIRAESLLVSALTVPSRETVSALTLLAHLGLSNASESLMWMYTGMAARMAIDMGLHQEQHHGDMSDADRRLDILTFWPIVLLDFSLCFGTGRQTSLNLDDITQVLPTEEDMRGGTTAAVRSPFPYAARQMLAFGPIINLLNGRQPDGPDKTASLRAARNAAFHVYNQLPPDMVWNTANQASQSPIYLQLHLWMHTMIANDYLSRVPEQQRETGTAASGAATPNPTASDVWRNSVRTIGDILVLSDVIDPHAYLSVPYINQAFYVAGCCYMKDLERYSAHERRPPLAENEQGASRSRKPQELYHSLLTSSALTSISRLQQGLERMTTYWSGISWISGALAHRTAGIPRNDIDLLAAQEQLAPYVSQPDVVRSDAGDNDAGKYPQLDLSDFNLFSLPFTTDGVEAVTMAGIADFATSR